MSVGRMVVHRKADSYVPRFGDLQLTAVNLSELVTAFLV